MQNISKKSMVMAASLLNFDKLKFKIEEKKETCNFNKLSNLSIFPFQLCVQANIIKDF